MLIRTVVDFRKRKNKYRIHIMLLAASWHRYARHSAPLEVYAIGDVPVCLSGFFSSLGVVSVSTEPSKNDFFSKTSNTIMGVKPSSENRILLLDNDIVFTNSIEPLLNLPPEKIYGSVSGNFRVRNSCWQVIQDDLELPLFKLKETPINDRFRKLVDPEYRLPILEYAYVNGGVLLFPAGTDFRALWEFQQEKIYRHFAKHPLRSNGVTTSNMAALATTIGTYGKFEYLPVAYNYRHKCFALGMCQANEIRMIHMTGRSRANTGTKSARDWVNKYWRHKMTSGFGSLQKLLDESEFSRRLKICDQMRRNTVETIKLYELDQLFKTIKNSET